MSDENELLFDELYEKTKDCGRVQFIKLLMQKERENQELKNKIKTYEDPEDLTLMFMYCDEKAKDKIKELKSKLELYENGVYFSSELDKKENQQKEFIEYLENEIRIGTFPKCVDNIILQKYKEIIGDDK